MKQRRDEMEKTGQIVKAMSGFYYIYDGVDIYQTRAKGIFRKKKLSPLVGDIVTFESESLEEGVLTHIQDRKNEFIRPPMANVDYAVVVMSAKEPDFSLKLVDRFFVYLEQQQISPILLITKMDLLSSAEKETLYAVKQLYETIGYRVSFSQELIDAPFSFLEGTENSIVMFMGQSGVGKSTLLNRLLPQLQLQTAAISKALGRGRHTTRHVELHRMEKTWIADTPGFSSIELQDVSQEELSDLFPEFRALKGQCKFRECSHIHEPSCAIKEEVEAERIERSRYDHYVSFMEELKQKKIIYKKAGQ